MILPLYLLCTMCTPRPLINQHTLIYPVLLLLRLLLHLASQRIPLCLDTLLSPLAGCLGLVALGLHFFLQDTLTLLLGLSLVDMLDQCSLVLEGVTLAQVIELVV